MPSPVFWTLQKIDFLANDDDYEDDDDDEDDDEYDNHNNEDNHNKEDHDKEDQDKEDQDKDKKKIDFFGLFWYWCYYLPTWRGWVLTRMRFFFIYEIFIV